MVKVVRPPIGEIPPRSAIPAPQIKVGPAGMSESLEPVAVGDLSTWRNNFLKACGTTEIVIAEAMVNQLLYVLRTDPTKPMSATTMNLALALLHRLAPRDELEAMLCIQLIATHFAGMDTIRRGLHADQSAAGRQAYLGLSRKCMGLFATQIEALNRLRGGNTVVQKVIVERVNVEPGGRALVGAVSRGSGGPEDG